MNRSHEFDLFLKTYRQNLSEAKRQRTTEPKPPVVIYPLATEQYYTKEISDLMSKFVAVSFDLLDSQLKKWLNEKSDSAVDDFEEFKKKMNDELIALYGASYALNTPSYNILVLMADRVFSHVKKEWNKQIKVIMEIPWQPSEEWWGEVRREWIYNNQTMMQKQAKDYISALEALIVTALQSLWSYPQLKTSIISLSEKFIGPRASLLARNEVGILNSLIWKNMYEEVGMKNYIWHTALDERVRGNPMGRYPKAIPSHWVMEGLIMDWGNMTVYSDDRGNTWKKKTPIMEPLHVGMAMGCRCVPLPFWDDKIKKADSDIGGQE